MSNACGATKNGAGKAGEAVGHAASKTAKAAKDAVTGDKNNK
jgi:hypothetical protein